MLVGGVEHMGHIPMTHGLDFHPLMAKRVARASGMMGMTVKCCQAIQSPRKQQDEFAGALTRCTSSYHSRRFEQEIVPIAVMTLKVSYKPFAPMK